MDEETPGSVDVAERRRQNGYDLTAAAAAAVGQVPSPQLGALGMA